MSKRRQVGEVVRKKANAGFISEPLIVKLVDLDEGTERSRANPLYRSYCIIYCDDDSCEEWANCEIIIDGKPTGNYCYHVSECEMEDL